MSTSTSSASSGLTSVGRAGAGAARDGGAVSDAHRIVQQRFVAAANRAHQHNAASQAELEQAMGELTLDFTARVHARHLDLQQELQRRQLEMQQRHVRLQAELRASLARQQAELEADLKSNRFVLTLAVTLVHSLSLELLNFLSLLNSLELSLS
jgi:hypothetical protein